MIPLELQLRNLMCHTCSQPPSRGRPRRESPRKPALGDEGGELFRAKVLLLPQCEKRLVL